MSSLIPSRGRVTVKGLDVHDVPVKTKDGRDAGSVSALASTIVLPAGDYQLQMGGVWRAFTLAEAQTLTISVKEKREL
mgnify:CR=1 FL=1